MYPVVDSQNGGLYLHHLSYMKAGSVYNNTPYINVHTFETDTRFAHWLWPDRCIYNNKIYI